MRLLLISNSTNFGGSYLGHCAGEIKDFLGTIRELVFVPYALHDLDGYTAKTRERYAQMGIDVKGVHSFPSPIDGIRRAQAIHIGGGNTFRLLKRLYDEKLIEPIRERVRGGVPYVGASAGTNVATVSIRTTNDMPIVYPPSFDALGFVPFNINPHYVEPEAGSTHMGETREQRIREFHEENTATVVGIREGAMLRIEGSKVILKGNGAKVFRPQQAPVEYAAGAEMDFLIP